MVSTGLIEWHASDVLCEYLLNSDEIKNGNSIRLLELGSGLGKCGLLLHLLLQSNGRSDSTVLTDGDTNVMQLLQKNVAFNTFSDLDNDNITCHKLRWGAAEATSFLSKQDYNQKFDLIIGSDLLYTNTNNLNPLFETIGVLLEDEYRYSPSSRVSAKFILAHNEGYSIPVKSVVLAASRKDLFCEVVKQVGEVSLLCFKRLHPMSVNQVVDKLQAKIMMLEAENRRQQARTEQVEDKCLKLDRRCTVLRGDKDLPTSILPSFDEDNLVRISSYLEPQDFASIASTCKYFGLGTHIIGIGDEHVSLIKKVANKIYEGASLEEKDMLPNQREDPFILYNYLLDLRKPLKFDRLLGNTIEHLKDKSVVKSLPHSVNGAVKAAPGTGRVFRASTAISNHVMRSGKHYVIFNCSDLSLELNSLLWFGIVRPLDQYKPDYNRSRFTPFCGDVVNELRRLKCPEWGDSNVHSCVYNAIDGKCQGTNWRRNENSRFKQFFKTEDWQGMQGIPFEGNCKVGLLLDCDRGTLTVYKNDIKLGVMKSGLSGAYCWMVSSGTLSMYTSASKAKIKIERGSPLNPEARSTLGKRVRTE